MRAAQYHYTTNTLTQYNWSLGGIIHANKFSASFVEDDTGQLKAKETSDIL